MRKGTQVRQKILGYYGITSSKIKNGHVFVKWENKTLEEPIESLIFLKSIERITQEINQKLTDIVCIRKNERKDEHNI